VIQPTETGAIFLQRRRKSTARQATGA